MLRKASKKFAAMLVLAMLATMFVGVGAASAVTTYTTVKAPPTVEADDTILQNLATIQIDISVLTTNGGNPHRLLISLPSGFEVADAAAALPVVGDVNGVLPGPCTVWHPTNPALLAVGDNVREFIVETPVLAVGDIADVKLTVSLPDIIVDGGASGDIKATFTNLAGDFSAGNVVVGKIGDSNVTVKVTEDALVSDGNPDAVEFEVKENLANSLDTDPRALTFKLPKGFAWNLPVAVTDIKGNIPAAALNVGIDPLDSRVLVVTRNFGGPQAGLLRVNANIRVDDVTVAKTGDIQVSLGGTTSAEPGNLVAGKYGDFGVKLVAKKELPEIIAGHVDQEIADFNIEEEVAGSLIANRTIRLELPAGAKWHTANTPNWTAGLGCTAPVLEGSDGRVLRFNTTNTSTTAGALKFTNVSVQTAVDFEGKLEVTITGAGIEKQTVELAKVQPALKVTMDTTKDVKIGVRDQAAGDITIVENVKETLIRGGTLDLWLPTGVEWAKTPTVKVTEGDVDIRNNDIRTNGRRLSIGINSESSKASTIVISDIKLDVDRTVPEGKLKFDVQGTAVDEVNNTAALVPPYGGMAVPNVNGELFPRNDVAATVTGANVVTPAPGEINNKSVFVIGSTSYVLNGKEYTMDVAPYIKNSRTYMPIRYIANAMGINDDNIMWDPDKQTVTLMRGNKVVQLTIGSNVLHINGIQVVMDVAPEIASSRTMLPARHVANAFGFNVEWDAATQTVTMTQVGQAITI